MAFELPDADFGGQLGGGGGREAGAMALEVPSGLSGSESDWYS